MAALTKTYQNLKMSARYDAHSQVDYLMQESVRMLDELHTERFDEQELKLCIKLVIEAIRPTVLRQSIHTELQTQRKKIYRESLPEFVAWLKPQVEAFVKFEAALYHHERRDAEGQGRIVSTRATKNKEPRGEPRFRSPVVAAYGKTPGSKGT